MTMLGGVPVAPVSEAQTGFVIGFYGPGGGGKTTLAATVCDTPLGWPALLINARGNPHVVRSRGDKLDVATITEFKQQEAIRQDLLRQPTIKYKSVMLDTVTEMHALDLKQRYGNREVQWTDHSASTADVLQLVRNWTDMAYPPYNLNIVFILWDTPETRKIRGQEVSRSEIALNKALQNHVPGIITWLGRLYIVQNNPPFTRCLDFRPIETIHQAKHQIDPDDERMKQIPMEVYNPSLASFIDVLKGGEKWPTEKHAMPRGLLTGGSNAQAQQR